MKHKIYLDDVRTPVDPEWIVVRGYDEFVTKVSEIGLNNIEVISLDHDLGETAMHEYYNNVASNYTLNYDNIYEKTGYDCAKWLVEHWFEINRPNDYGHFPTVYTHSANPIGSANIMGYINNFWKNCSKPQTCIRVRIEHDV